MVRYKKLGIVELNVSDLSRAKDFYEGLVGLEFAGAGPQGELRFRCCDDPYSIVLHEKSVPGFKRVGWMLEDNAQFEALSRVLRDHSVPLEWLSAQECAERGFERACRMAEPYTGAVQEFYILPDGTQAAPWKPTLARIQRIGHVAWWTPRKEESIGFFRDVLNFRESDSVGDFVTFMRCFPNPYHHGMGIARGAKTGLHHVNFMVTEIDDVGKAFHRFNANKVPIMKGLGRHPASNSVFLYYLDPDGLSLEYSFGMEEFPEHNARPARKLPPVPESTDTWGTPTDQRYAKTGEIEPYAAPVGG